MASTRLNNDVISMELRNKTNLNQSEYMLDVPGNGQTPDYIEDPHIRLQKFGGNISSRIVDVNSNLLGINRKIGRDCTQARFDNCEYSKINFPNKCEVVTDESRATMPAWELRDLETHRTGLLLQNPQNHVEMQFSNNISSRILEKNNYIPEFPYIN